MDNLNYFTQQTTSPLSMMSNIYEPFSIDAIINSTIQNKAEALRPRIREIYQKKESEKQQQELADEAEKQKQIGSVMKGLQQGIEMLSPKAKDNPEIGGQNKGEQAAQTAGRQEATVEAGENLAQANRSYESTVGSLKEAAGDQNIGAYQKAMGVLPGIAQNAMGAYDLYNKVESGTATAEDYANLGISATGTTGNMMRTLGEKGSSLYSTGGTLGGAAGALGGGLGVYQGIQGILNNPNDPSNYINTAVSGATTYQGVNALLDSASSVVPEATATAAGQVATPMAADAATTAATTTAPAGAGTVGSVFSSALPYIPYYGWAKMGGVAAGAMRDKFYGKNTSNFGSQFLEGGQRSLGQPLSVEQSYADMGADKGWWDKGTAKGVAAFLNTPGAITDKLFEMFDWDIRI